MYSLVASRGRASNESAVFPYLHAPMLAQWRLHNIYQDLYQTREIAELSYGFAYYDWPRAMIGPEAMTREHVSEARRTSSVPQRE